MKRVAGLLLAVVPVSAVAACGGGHEAALLKPPSVTRPTALPATTLQDCALREGDYLHALAEGQQFAISWFKGASSSVRKAVIARLRRDRQVAAVAEHTGDETRAWLNANCVASVAAQLGSGAPDVVSARLNTSVPSTEISVLRRYDHGLPGQPSVGLDDLLRRCTDAAKRDHPTDESAGIAAARDCLSKLGYPASDIPF